MSKQATEPRSERVLLDGWDAHVLRWGEPRAERVVLLHGFTGHAAAWQHLASRLGVDHDVVALDQRGHGRSAPTDRFGIRILVSDLEHLLDVLDWERASIVGHSMGGVTAFVFAAKSPRRVERLVVVDVGPEAAATGAARIQEGFSRPDLFYSLDEALEEGRRSFPDAEEELLRHRVEENLVRDTTGRFTWRTARSLRDGTAVRDDLDVAERWEAWRSVTVPTLLVHGVKSDILTAPLLADLVADRPDLEVVDIEGAGHSVPLDRPDELADVVREFLATAREARVTP